MRIISGEYKGRRYSGAIPPEIRPTTDNVRESIFNILENYIDFDKIYVADICAGTGLMGFEALSRGASFCYFFEKSRKAVTLIHKIAETIIPLTISSQSDKTPDRASLNCHSERSEESQVLLDKIKPQVLSGIIPDRITLDSHSERSEESQVVSGKKNFRIIFGDAPKKINSLSKDCPELKLNLIFFDPPYNSMIFNPVIDSVNNSNLVQKGTIFVIEHSVKSKLMLPAQWELLTERIFGDTGVVFARYQ